jgi:hypothetical protein
MALQRDTITVGLAKSVNQKVDSKILGSEQMSSVKDCVFDKDEQIVKRYGQSAQGTTVQTSFPNPLAIGTFNSKTKSFAHENQLCQINGGALYSQNEGQNKWLFKGHCAQVGVTTTPIQSGTVFTDVVTVSGITVMMSATSVLVREDQTGATIATNTISNGLRLVAFSSAVWVLWGSGANLKAQQVSLTTGALSAAINLRTDMAAAVVPRMISVAIASSSSLLGEMAFIVYPSTTSSTFYVVPMDATGTTPALSVLNTTRAYNTTTDAVSLYIEPSVNQNRFWLAYTGSGTTVYSASWTFTSGAYSNVYGPTSIATVSDLNSVSATYQITQAINPINNTELYVFWDNEVWYGSNFSGTYTQPYSVDCTLSYAVLSFAGAVTTAATVYGRGYEIAGAPIRDTSRQTIYLPVVSCSPLQTALFLLDILKGKSTYNNYAVAKCLFGLAARPTVHSKCRTTGSTTYRMTNNGYLVDFSLAPTYAPQSKYISKTTHLTGGILWAFDGDSVSEHGFLQGPEVQSVFVGKAGLVLTVNRVGDASHTEQFSLTCPQGNALLASAGTYGYLQFNSTVAGYYVWFKVDGSGTDPAPGGRTGIRVDVLSTDAAADVGAKVLAAVNAFFGSTVYIASLTLSFDDYGPVVTTASVVFTATSNGAVTAPSLNGAITSNGLLSVGSYQFCACYKWTDRNGNVYRSAPSVATTVTAAALDRATMLVWAPAVTNHLATSVQVEVYRTQVNGSVFQLVTTGAMSETSSRVSFSDVGTSDITLASNEIIYTDGGVLENSNIGACTALSVYKNRLLATSIDDPTAIAYSRAVLNGEPANFSSFLALRLDTDGLPVTGHDQMDDKLAIFKQDSCYITAGDGANDLGQGESFQLPMRIPGDLGLINPNSLILSNAGLIFQSNGKGIYALGRGLQLAYIGAAVDDYKSNVVSSAVLAKNFDHIIFGLQDSTTALVYNQLLGRWDFWTAQQSDSACLWQNKYVRAQASGKVFVEGTNYYDTDGSTQSISMYAETAWLKLKGLEGFQRVYKMILLGDYKSAHTVTFQLQYDYDTTTSTSYTFDASTISTDPPYQVELQPARQKCQALKVIVSEVPAGGTQQSAIWNVLEFEAGLKTGLYPIKATKSI